MTKKIKFITDLSNWDKTTCIQKLLDVSGSFESADEGTYKIFSVGNSKVMTLQFSNCDLSLEKYIDELDQHERKDDYQDLKC